MILRNCNWYWQSLIIDNHFNKLLANKTAKAISSQTMITGSRKSRLVYIFCSLDASGHTYSPTLTESGEPECQLRIALFRRISCSQTQQVGFDQRIACQPQMSHRIVRAIQKWIDQRSKPLASFFCSDCPSYPILCTALTPQGFQRSFHYKLQLPPFTAIVMIGAQNNMD